MKWRRARAVDDADALPPAPPQPGVVRMTAFVHGMVQGVGFRWWTRSRALELGLVGSARNLLDGRVEIVVEGSRQACEELVEQIRGAAAPGGVQQVVVQFADPRGELGGFSVH